MIRNTFLKRAFSPGGKLLFVLIVGSILWLIENFSSLNLSLPGVSNTPTSFSGETLYSVKRVNDGDTITIDYNGKEEKVRLLGIDTPEPRGVEKTNFKVECYGKEASDYAKQLMASKKVYLRFDDPDEPRDRYDRLLGYVYTDDGRFVNLEMLSGGFSDLYKTQHRYDDLFSETFWDAKNGERGMWEACV